MTTLVGDRYQLGATLGQGGMATVYAAHDTLLGREVALKILHAAAQSDEAARSRFEQEARLAAGFSHPHIARVYDVGVDPAYGPFFVQELVAGQSLDALLPVAAPQALAWTREIAGALAAVHAHGMVHCDVKPQNIRVTAEGRAMLLDFGVAESAGSQPGSTIYGTPQYLAPERAQGAAPAPAADVYALGILLYELLTGRVPFDGGSAAEIMRRHISEGVPALRATNPGSAASIEAIISRATERDPAARYPAVQELIADIEAVERQASSATVGMAPVSPRATVSIHNAATTISPVVAAPAPAASPTPAPAPASPPVAPLPPLPAAVAQPAARPAAPAPSIAAAPPPPAILPARPAKPARRLAPLALILALLAIGGITWALIRGPAGSDQAAATPSVPSVAPGAPLAPALVGLPLDEAERLAAARGIELNVLEQPSSAVPAGTVIAQEPAADAALSGGTMQVLVSAGAPAAPTDGGSDNGNKDNGKGNDKGKGKDGGKKDK